jgi:predicted O-methyltransferase YrrM
MKYEKTSEKSSTKTSVDVVDEILQLLQRHGVIYVNRVLFEGKSPTELAALKERIRNVIFKYNC